MTKEQEQEFEQLMDSFEVHISPTIQNRIKEFIEKIIQGS